MVRSLGSREAKKQPNLSHTISKRKGFISCNNGGYELGYRMLWMTPLIWRHFLKKKYMRVQVGGHPAGLGDNGQVSNDAEHAGDE